MGDLEPKALSRTVCASAQLQPVPPSPAPQAMSLLLFPPIAHQLAAGLRSRHNPNYVHSCTASLLRHSHPMSVTRFISHLKTGCSQPPRASYPRVGAFGGQCLAPSQVSGHSPAPWEERERERDLQTGRFLGASLITACGRPFSRGGWDGLYCEGSHKGSAVAACRAGRPLHAEEGQHSKVGQWR